MADSTISVRTRSRKSGAATTMESFQHLIQHIKQDDPMLYEALKKTYEQTRANTLIINEFLGEEEEPEVKKPPVDGDVGDLEVTSLVIGGVLVSHLTGVLITGTIHYPTTHPNYGSLKFVEVEFRFPALVPDGKGIVIARYGKPTPPATTQAFEIRDDRILLGFADVPGCEIEFYTVDEDYQLGPNPLIIPVTLPKYGITSVSGTENTSTRWQTKDTRQVHSVVPITVVPVNSIPFYTKLWTSHSPEGSPNGARRMHGWFPIEGNTTVTIGSEGTSTELYSPLVRDETWTATAEVWLDESNEPTGLAVNGPIVGDGSGGLIAKAQLPATGLITSIDVPAGTKPDPFPYDMLVDGDITHYWSIGYVQVNTTASFDAVNVFTVLLTAQDLGPGGTPIGPEHIYGTPLPVRGTLNFGKLDGPYGTKADPPRSGSIEAVRLKAYLANRTNQTTAAWQDPAAATLQATRVVQVAIGGAVPGTETPGVTPPGYPTIGAITYKWAETTELLAKEVCAFELSIPVTAPTPLGPYAGVHLWLEVPDGSGSTFRFSAGGGKLGTDRASSVWLPQDYGQYPHDGSATQLLRARVANVPVAEGSTLDVRVYVQPFSASYDAPPIRKGAVGETPSFVVTILPQTSPKPGSGANITPYKVPSLTALVGPPQYVNNRMQTPVTVTVSLAGLPTALPSGWGYRLIAYLGDNLTGAPIWTSSVLQKSGVIPADADDGISGAHTFGIITPSDVMTMTIYGVAGLMAADGVTFQQNNIIPGITASASVNVGAIVSVVTISEVGNRWQNPPGGSTYTTIRVTASQVGATTATIWFTYNDGASYAWIGAYPFTRASYHDVAIMIPQGTSTFRAKVAVGSYPGDAPPPVSAIASNALTLTIGAPLANLTSATITNLTGAAPTVANIYTGASDTGNPYATVVIKLTTPGAGDPHAFYYWIWVQWTDAAGTPITPGGFGNSPGWQPGNQFVNDGTTQQWNLQINYPAPGVNAYLTMQIWGFSRNSTGTTAPFTGDPGATLQACWSSATFYRLNVGQPVSVSALTIAESGARYQSPPGGNTYTTISATCSFSQSAQAQNLTLWMTTNNGGTWVWQGVFTFAGTSDAKMLPLLIPLGTANVIVRAATGAYPASAGPPVSAFSSNMLTISIGTASPSASVLSITNQFGSAPTQSNIFMGRDINGPYARVVFSIQTPGNSDTATYFYHWWVMWVDASGNPINPGNVLNTSGWQNHYTTPNDGQLEKHNLDINYPAVANAYLEIRVYARTRNSTGSSAPFAGDSGATAIQWPGGLTYYRLQVGLPPGNDVVTNPGNDQNSNPTISMLSNWSFLFNNPGFWIQSGARSGAGYLAGWNTATQASSSMECRADGGSSGTNYLRLTGADTSISQTVSVIANAKLYFSIAVRSSNHSTGHGVGIYIDWLDANRASITPFTTNIGTVGGYVSAWTAKAITGYATVPANAAFAIVRVSTSASEPAGGYWDLDDVVMQAVLSQQVGGGTAEVSNGGDGSNGTGTFRATAVAYSAVYGQDYAEMIGGVAGQRLLLHNNTVSMRQTRGQSGVGQFDVGTADNYHVFAISLQDSGIAIGQYIAGTLFTGYTGTVTTGAGTKNVKNGIICN